jgi:hypothetical protein
MALPKRVKKGGSYYKGYELIVSDAAGDYTLDMAETSGAVVNSMSIIPDAYGTGDTFTVSHLNNGTTDTLAILADTIYNPGANVPTMFDFPAYEQMDSNEVLRLVYTNTAGTALNVHVIVEYGGIRKTS